MKDPLSCFTNINEKILYVLTFGTHTSVHETDIKQERVYILKLPAIKNKKKRGEKVIFF